MRRYIIIFLSLVWLSACIRNDIPYPVVELYITSIEGDGFTMNEPNNDERTILLSLDEDTDIEQVRFTNVSYSPEQQFSSTLQLNNTYNLKVPLDVTLSLYQDYTWTISAEQIIERYFKVENQIGSAIINPSKHTATAYVSETTNLDEIKVLDLKLGPAEITTYDVELSELTQFDSYRVVNISYHNTTERWKLYIEHTDVKVSIGQSDVRATTAALTAEGDTASATCSFGYRTSGSEEWTTVDQSAITVGDGSFSTIIKGLEPNSEYEFLATLGNDTSEVITATTESLLPLPNGDFEQWSFPATFNGRPNKSWFPFLEGGEQYWGSGNQGATTLGEGYNLTTPSEDTAPQSKGKFSADLQSKNTLKFATGSIFTGAYLKTAGTNGIIGLGRPFNSRPVGIRGWLKYNQGIVDMVGSVPPGVSIVKGETPDQGSIFMALGTWEPAQYGVSAYEKEPLGTAEIPLIVDTRDPSTFFNKNSDAVVAYGEMIFNETIGEWREFEIKLDYRTLSVQPTHLVIVCSASRYGDYFTGSSKSKMLLDDLELIWE